MERPSISYEPTRPVRRQPSQDEWIVLPDPTPQDEAEEWDLASPRGRRRFSARSSLDLLRRRPSRSSGAVGEAGGSSRPGTAPEIGYGGMMGASVSTPTLLGSAGRLLYPTPKRASSPSPHRRSTTPTPTPSGSSPTYYSPTSTFSRLLHPAPPLSASSVPPPRRNSRSADTTEPLPTLEHASYSPYSPYTGLPPPPSSSPSPSSSSSRRPSFARIKSVPVPGCISDEPFSSGSTPRRRASTRSSAAWSCTTDDSSILSHPHSHHHHHHAHPLHSHSLVPPSPSRAQTSPYPSTRSSNSHHSSTSTSSGDGDSTHKRRVLDEPFLARLKPKQRSLKLLFSPKKRRAAQAASSSSRPSTPSPLADPPLALPPKSPATPRHAHSLSDTTTPQHAHELRAKRSRSSIKDGKIGSEPARSPSLKPTLTTATAVAWVDFPSVGGLDLDLSLQDLRSEIERAFGVGLEHGERTPSEEELMRRRVWETARDRGRVKSLRLPPRPASTPPVLESSEPPRTPPPPPRPSDPALQPMNPLPSPARSYRPRNSSFAPASPTSPNPTSSPAVPRFPLPHARADPGTPRSRRNASDTADLLPDTTRAASSPPPPPAPAPPMPELPKAVPSPPVREPENVVRGWQVILDRLVQLRREPVQDKAVYIREVFATFAEVDMAYVPAPGARERARRDVLFEWIQTLLLELAGQQVAAERGACLEGVAAILESRTLSAAALAASPSDARRMLDALRLVMDYCVTKLNSKGVFQNTIVFCGRIFAVAFFRMRGVAQQLLKPLVVRRQLMERLAKEAGWSYASTPLYPPALFPQFLSALCFSDVRTYLASLDAYPRPSDPPPDFLLEPGNWLRRWVSDDSELFFSFTRAYHRQLAPYLSLVSSTPTTEREPRHTFAVPGYAHLATVFHAKIMALVHGDIYSVTTGASARDNFTTSETANVLAATSGKPKVLELANKRIVSTLHDIVTGLSSGSGFLNARTSDDCHLWTPILDLHLRAAVHSTNMYAAPQVFCLLDALDGIIAAGQTVAAKTGKHALDVFFILDFLHILLYQCDHALTLIRTISFIFTHFDFICHEHQHRVRLCHHMLLNAHLFERLTLFWSQSVRAYWLRLLVFRVGHIRSDAADPAVIETVDRFNERLDALRARHEELEPSRSGRGSVDEDEDEQDDESRPRLLHKRSTISIVGRRQSSTDELHAPPSDAGHPPPQEGKAAAWFRSLSGSSPPSRSGSVPAPLDVAAANALLQAAPEIREHSASPRSSIDSLASESSSLAAPPSTAPSTTENGSESEPPALAFEFELQPKSPAVESASLLDQQNLAAPASPAGAAAGAPPSSPRPLRFSRSFSKRDSILPPPAAGILSPTGTMRRKAERPRGYPTHLHVYAVRALAEYESIVEVEYQSQNWRESVPRLSVSWPIAFSFDS